MIDWLDDFVSKFGHYKEIHTLKTEKFHGKLELNFLSGDLQNYNLTTHRKAVAIDNNSTQGDKIR